MIAFIPNLFPFTSVSDYLSLFIILIPSLLIFFHTFPSISSIHHLFLFSSSQIDPILIVLFSLHFPLLLLKLDN